jgi:hypothetical protein
MKEAATIINLGQKEWTARQPIKKKIGPDSVMSDMRKGKAKKSKTYLEGKKKKSIKNGMQCERRLLCTI